MQKWEYLQLTQARKRGEAWNPPQIDLNELGEDGWELVSVHSVSSAFALPVPLMEGSFLNNPYTIPTENVAGYTTEQIWVFKRPKP